MPFSLSLSDIGGQQRRPAMLRHDSLFAVSTPSLCTKRGDDDAHQKRLIGLLNCKRCAQLTAFNLKSLSPVQLLSQGHSPFSLLWDPQLRTKQETLVWV